MEVLVATSTISIQPYLLLILSPKEHFLLLGISITKSAVFYFYLYLQSETPGSSLTHYFPVDDMGLSITLPPQRPKRSPCDISQVLCNLGILKLERQYMGGVPHLYLYDFTIQSWKFSLPCCKLIFDSLYHQLPKQFLSWVVPLRRPKCFTGRLCTSQSREQGI